MNTKSKLLKSIFISLILVMGVNNAWAEPWLCRSTAGGKIATKTVGDKLNDGNEWNYTYTTNGGWSSETDIQVCVGTSTSSYTTVNAGWKSDDGSNKNVAANIGSVSFDKSGKWYAVGKYKSGNTTAYTTKKDEWTNNTTLSMGSNNEPYWEVTPPAVSNFSVSVSGYLSGTGTSNDPYIIQPGNSLQITLSGNQAKTDDNSTVQYNTAGTWNTTNSRTISNITSTTKTSVTVKMRCHNSSANLSGTESSKTIYYKAATASTYTINLDNQGGSGATSVSATYNTKLPNVEVPKKDGYTFKGYFEATNGGGFQWYNENGICSVNWNKQSGATLYAHWVANTYNVIFDENANDATGAINQQTFTYDQSKALHQNNFIRVGYYFAGWNTKADGTGKTYTDQQSVKNLATSGTTTLYAQWTKITISATLSPNTVNIGSHNLTFSITSNVPKNSGYQVGAYVLRMDHSLNGYIANPIQYNQDAQTLTAQNQSFNQDGLYYTRAFILKGSTILAKSDEITLKVGAFTNKNIYLVGQFNEWKDNDNNYKFEETGPGIYTLTKHFEKRERYNAEKASQAEWEFKLLVDGTKYTVEGNGAAKVLQYTRQNKTKVLSDSHAYNSDPYYNLLLQADQTGDYVFTYNANTKVLTVTHPEYSPAASYIVGDFSDGQPGTDATPKDGGAGKDWTEMYGEDITSSTEVCFPPGESWNFKIKINGIWYGAENLVISESGTYILSNEYADAGQRYCAIQTSVSGCYDISYEPGDNAGEIKLTVTYPEPTYLYLKPNSNWKSNGARFAAYFFGNGETWKDMTDVGCNGDYYRCEMPVGYSNVIFCRMNPDGTDNYNDYNNWNNKWNQTSDLIIPKDGNNLFTVPSGSWNDATTTWSTYSVPKYAITLTQATGGTITVSKSSDITLNEQVTVTMTPNEGYTFKSGTIEIGNQEQQTISTTTSTHTICGPTSITAQWTPNTYYVAFNANTGTGTMEQQTFQYATSQNLKANEFTKTGYTFTGWNTAADGSGDSYTDQQSVNNLTTENNATITLYAQWTPTIYNITYKDQGGGTFSGTHEDEDDYPKQHTYDSDTQLKGAGKMGYTFEGWFTNKECTEGPITTLGATAYTADITLYAKWEIRNLYIHADFVNWEGRLIEPEFKDNTVVYTYTGILEKKESSYNNKHTMWDGGHHFHYLYSLEGIEKPETQKIAYNYYNVDAGNISYTQDLIDAVHLTDDNNPTIQFGLTKKSRVTITLTLVSDIETDDKATQPDVAIVAIPCNTITLDQTGARTQGTVTSVEVPNGDSMPEITGDGALPTPQIGYTFMGYFDQKDGKGTQYYNANGTSEHAWDKTEDATLYAYFQPAKITNITLEDKEVFEPVTSGEAYVTATPTIDPEDIEDVVVCWRLLYSNGDEVTEHKAIDAGDNKVKFSIVGLATGTYTIEATLHATACGNGEPISELTKNFIIASEYTVTVKYTCDNQEIKASTTAPAHATEPTTLEASDIFGYTFKEWVAGDGVEIKTTSGDGKTITYTATYNGTITAKYTKKKLIYLDLSQQFSESGKWSDPYIYLYGSNGYWDNEKGAGATGDACKAKGAMTKIEGTDIWYYDYSNVAGFTKYLAFTWGDSRGKANFDFGDVIYRGDFSEGTPLFVPATDQTKEDKNGAKYYSKGYWVNYIGEHTGYTLIIYNEAGDKELIRQKFTSANKRMNMTSVIDLEAEHKYQYEVLRDHGYYYKYNSSQLTNINRGPKPLNTADKGTIITTAAGDYTFTLGYKSGDLQISVDYPAAVGDYRILYRDAAEKTWSGKDKNKEGNEIKWYHASRVIKKGTDTKDIISFFINKDIRRTLSYQTIEAIDKDGNITWSETEVEFSHVDWSQIDTSGVYNFVFVQDGRSISLENTIEPYTGNYYIRCDAMDGKWEDYKTNPDNRMFYSAFSESDANSFGDKFSHYATKWCEAGTNVKFTIANDYSHCISDTLAQDINSLGNLTDEGTLLNNDIYDVNIRFMWNWKTNKISRAYVGPAGDKQSQFLMLKACEEIQDAEGNKLNPAEGDILDEENDIYAARFTDTQNWIYERTIQVKPRTRVKLYASYPNGYHIYIENNTGWKDVALYAFKNGEGEPLGPWPGVQPTRTVKIGDKTYYDFPVNKYVFGSTLIFNNNVKENGQQTSNYTDFATVGEYYLTASSNKELTKNKYVQTTVEATAQYFRGEYAEGSCDDEHTIQILGGEGETWNTIRVIYDFKTNRLMAAWMPNNNEIDTVRSIESDVMIIRDHQNAAQCITFANDSSKLTYVKTVYGVMRFNRWILNNRGGADNLDIESCTKVVDNQTVYDHDITNKYHPILEPSKQTSQYERALYFISFPFDVHLSDVFGFGTYGQHWIIEYYDGLKRAKEGYWIDSNPNWKYVTDPANFVLEKYKGYILCLNLGKMAYDNTDFWAHNISQVELFFPSTTTMEEIAKAEVTMPKLGEEYLCKINRGDGTEGDRRVKDSYWRCIGVPSYANYSNVLKDEEGNPIQWQTSYKTFPFLYKWNKTDNTLTPQSTTNFKFETMHAYLVQNGGEIHWSAVNATPDKPNAGIIAKVKETTRNYEWRITLTQGEKEQDQAFVRLSDNEKVTTEFDFNQDLSKEFNYGRSDIYTLIGYEKAAANSLPLSEQTTLIPLGLSIEYNGDYTIAMPDGTANIGVTLIDTESNTRTNLSAGMEYTLTLKKGDYNNRFFIEISPIQQTPTDIEYVENSHDDQARKVLIDNILYIVRDGQIFDARGARVK